MSTPTSKDWTPGTTPPPQKTLVDAMRSDGEVVRLYFENGLYWFEDRSMYIYYMPAYWKPATD